MKHTYIIHATFDTGSADPEGALMEEVREVAAAAKPGLRTLQHFYAGHDMPATVTVHAVHPADELDHNLALIAEAIAEARAKRESGAR